MKKRLFFWIFLTLAHIAATTAASKKFTLVIDAGHGGHDTGAVGSLTKEKTINLNVALAFGQLVERNCPDVKVVYTRKTDVFVPLHERADMANRNKADLFISIHTNSLPRGRIARGMETYTLGMHRAADNLDVAKRENAVILIEKDYKQRYEGFDPNSAESYIMFEFMQDHNMAQSVELAKFVQKRTCAAASRQDKGVKQAGFLVLRETSMPSCLIELGFISTADEEQFLHSKGGVDKLGRGIYEAFLDYKKKYSGGITVPYKAAASKEVNIPTVVPADVARQAGEKAARQQAAKSGRKKSKVAQELADIREGRADAEAVATRSAAGPDADSIVQAAVASPEPAAQKAAPSAAKPEPATQKAAPTTPAVKAPAAPAADPQPSQEVPVFKVQILASSTRLAAGDAQLKGQPDADCYQDGGLYKYTVGASENYNEIYQLRKALLDRFPQAFIIAFKGGRRTDVQQAIHEFKSRRTGGK